MNEEWLVLPGIILVFILSDILRKEGCDSFTVSEGNLKETENLSGCYEDEKPNLSNTMGLEVESKMEGPEGNAVMPEEGRSHSGGCGSGCGGGCGNMVKSGGCGGGGCGGGCGGCGGECGISFRTGDSTGESTYGTNAGNPCTGEHLREAPPTQMNATAVA